MQPASNRSSFFPRVSSEWKARLRHENGNCYYSSARIFLVNMTFMHRYNSRKFVGQSKALRRTYQKSEEARAFVNSPVYWNGKCTIELHSQIDVANRKSKRQTKIPRTAKIITANCARIAVKCMCCCQTKSTFDSYASSTCTDNISARVLFIDTNITRLSAKYIMYFRDILFENV